MTIKEIVLLAPVFVSLFAGINLFLFPWKGNQSRLILGTFLVLTAWFFAVIALYQVGNFKLYQYFDGVFMSLLLVFHPLFYFYVWSVTSGRKLFPMQAWHFIPAACTFLASYLIFFLMSEQERVYYLSQYMNGVFIPNTSMQALYFVFKSGKLIHLAQALVYFTLSLRLILHHREHLEEYFSSNANRRLNWLLVYNILLILPALGAIVVTLVPTPVLNNDSRYILITFSIFTLFYGAIGIIGARQRRLYPESLSEKPLFAVLPGGKPGIGHLREELLRFFKEEKPYCNPDLEIWDLCFHLNSNRTYISQLINEEFGVNFSGFVNSYRVKEAQRLLGIEANKQYTLETIAIMAGFNSQVSMNRWFKKYTNQSPREYRESEQQMKPASADEKKVL